MNSEYALNIAKATLIEKLPAEIALIEAEAEATSSVDAIQESHIGDYLPTEFTQFPALYLKANTSGDANDQDQFQERILNFSIVIWIVEVDAELLHRYILRYGDAVGRVLRKAENWANYLHTQKVGVTTYSDLYTTEHGLAQGCEIQASINYIVAD